MYRLRKMQKHIASDELTVEIAKDEVSQASKGSKCNLLQCITKDKGVRFPVYLTVILFSMSTWMTISSLFVEMPLLVDLLPESWSLPSLLVIIIQCANLGPAIYAVITKLKSSTKTKAAVSPPVAWFRDVEISLILVILAVSLISVMLLSFLWMVTVKVNDSAHSFPLFALACISALASCTSSVVTLPFMARFKPGYISAYYIGLGFGSMIPGLLGLAQGLGQEPVCVSGNDTVLNGTIFMESNVSTKPGVTVVKQQPPMFSVSIFFGVISILLVISTTAFYILNFSTFCRREMVRPEKSFRVPEKVVDEGKVDNVSDGKNEPLLASETSRILEEKDSSKKHGRTILLLVYVGILNCMTNSLLPGTMSYTCLPYGRITYTLSVRLASVASPLASLSTLFLPSASLILISSLMVMSSAIAIFYLVLAGFSPDRAIEDLLTGQLLLIISSIVMMSSFSYVRVAIASHLRETGGRKSLFLCGCVTQLGSFCGAVVAIVLVQVLHLFKSRKPCDV